MSIIPDVETRQPITLSVSGKFHALSLAKEYARQGLLGGVYCVNRKFQAPSGIPQDLYRNRIDLLFYQVLTTRLPFIGAKAKSKEQLFDDWMANQLPKLTPGVLHGWNGCSYKTFKTAKKLGWTSFVERSCPHNQYQFDLLTEEADRIGVKHHQDPEALKYAIEELYLADYIVCPSNYSANSYKDPELISKLGCVSLGGNYAYKERTAKSEDNLRILMVGNHFLRKGTHYLIEAMNYIDDPKAELWIRGEVPDSYIKRIKDPRIKVIGAVSFDELNNLYSSANVFVQPSVDEGFGMTVLEALSYGLPVVATEHVGAVDILNDKVSKVVPIRDPMALATAITASRELVSAQFDAERKSILETYTWARCANSLINEVYNMKTSKV